MKIVNKKKALEKLQAGFPIIFQTDTLPAIGCLPKFSKKIYEIKKRDPNKPLILMGAETKQLIDFVHSSAKEDYKEITSKYWPGPLTVIIPVSEKKESFSTSQDLTLGLRIPNSFMAQSLIKESGALLTSSANISGVKGSLTAKNISHELPDVHILGPIPWEKCSGSASTIISWVRKREWKLIREGQLSFRS